MLYSYYASFAAQDCEIRTWGLGATWAGSNFDRGLQCSVRIHNYGSQRYKNRILLSFCISCALD